MAKITAVIDIGSNSVRMAIFKKTSQFGFYLLYEIKSKVRISQGTYGHKGELQKAPMKRALKALNEFKEIAQKYKSRKILCVATSAVRDAPNSKEFVALVKRLCDLQVKVIDGYKEAFYGGVACANLLHHKDGITIDIGGGSTECALIEKGKIRDLISLNLGTIRLKELFFDKHLKASLAKDFIREEMQKIPAHFKTTHIFGVGGTIRALAKVVMQHNNYPIDVIHGFEMGVKQNWALMQEIIHTPEEDLEGLGVSADRQDTIRSGTLIFTMLLEHFNAQMVVTSGVGVREGVFLSDMLRNHNHTFPNNINPSILSLLDRFLPHSKHSQEVKKACSKLFEVLKPLHGIEDKYLYHLKIAGQLSSIGKVLNFYDAHKHGAYLSLHSLSYGFSHQDRAIICLLVQFSHKKIPKDSNIAHINSIMPPILTLQWLSFILGLAEALCLIGVPKDTQYSLKNKTLNIKSPKNFYLCQEAVAKLVQPIPLSIEFTWTSPLLGFQRWAMWWWVRFFCPLSRNITQKHGFIGSLMKPLPLCWKIAPTLMYYTPYPIKKPCVLKTPLPLGSFIKIYAIWGFLISSLTCRAYSNLLSLGFFWLKNPPNALWALMHAPLKNP